MSTTKQQVSAMLLSASAIAEAIRDLGSVPSGHLYATLQSSNLSLAAYQSLISMLKRSGLVSEKSHLLTWIGPK